MVFPEEENCSKCSLVKAKKFVLVIGLIFILFSGVHWLNHLIYRHSVVVHESSSVMPTIHVNCGAPLPPSTNFTQIIQLPLYHDDTNATSTAVSTVQVDVTTPLPIEMSTATTEEFRSTDDLTTVLPIISSTTENVYQELPIPFERYRCRVIVYHQMCVSFLDRICVLARRSTLLRRSLNVTVYDRSRTFASVKETVEFENACLGYTQYFA